VVSQKRSIYPKTPSQFQPVFYQPTPALFQSNQEFQYYRLFCTTIAPYLCGNPDSDLWNRLILQACESKLSIRYAVIAIAALKSTSEAKHSAISSTAADAAIASMHHQFALRVYSKAIRSMRDNVLSEKQDLRTTLLSCIVLTCFETFHGDHKSALKQIGIGIKIIQDHLLDDNLFEPKIPNVEHEIIQAFGRLEIQAMTFADSRSTESHRKMKDFGQASIDVMPTEFKTFKESEFYFEIIIQRLLHWGVSCVMPDHSSGCLKLDTSLCIPDDQLQDREKYLGEMRRWHDAFVPILKEARTSGSQRFFLGACSMQLLYLNSYFTAAGIRDSSLEYPDTKKFMPIFNQILSLSRTILENPRRAQGRSTFAFEMHVVAPLYNTARRCPHRGLRREAISLLFLYPRREGLWDSILSGLLAEWVMLLEEENLEEAMEFVPGHLRCRGLDILECDMIARKAFVTCLVPNKDGSELIHHENDLTW
jgi:hypothetical protein